MVSLFLQDYYPFVFTHSNGFMLQICWLSSKENPLGMALLKVKFIYTEAKPSFNETKMKPETTFIADFGGYIKARNKVNVNIPMHKILRL